MTGGEEASRGRLPSRADLRASIGALGRARQIIPVRYDWLALSGLLNLSPPLVAYAEIVIIGALIDRLAAGASVGQHLVLVAALLLLLCMRPLMSAARGILSFALQSLIATEARRRLIAHVTALDPPAPTEDHGRIHHIERNSLSVVTDHLTDRPVGALVDVASLVVALVILIQFSLAAAAGFLVVMVLWAVISLSFYGAYESQSEAMFSSVTETRGQFLATLGAARDVRALGRTDAVAERYRGAIQRENVVAGWFQVLSFKDRWASQIVPLLITLLTYGYGGLLVIDGALTVGQLVAFSMITARAVEPMGEIFDYIQSLANARVSADRLNGLVGAATVRPVPRCDTPGTLAALRGAAVTRGQEALPCPDITIRAGEIWRVTGDSGAGKSRLLRGLVLGEAGVSGVAHGPGCHAVLLGPAPGFLKGDLRDNLMLGTPEEPAPEELDALLALAELDIERVGEGAGTGAAAGWATVPESLSQGEAQRAALVRALLSQPTLLAFDEALSGVPQAQEARILATLRAARPELALILVSHREKAALPPDHEIAVGARIMLR